MNLSYEEKLTELVLFAWRGDLTSAYMYLKSRCEENGPDIFSGTQKQDNGQWAQKETQEVLSQYQENFFTLRVTEHWSRLPREPRQYVLDKPALAEVWTR